MHPFPISDSVLTSGATEVTDTTELRVMTLICATRFGSPWVPLCFKAATIVRGMYKGK